MKAADGFQIGQRHRTNCSGWNSLISKSSASDVLSLDAPRRLIRCIFSRKLCATMGAEEVTATLKTLIDRFLLGNYNLLGDLGTQVEAFVAVYIHPTPLGS
jgi:hypothetical protein